MVAVRRVLLIALAVLVTAGALRNTLADDADVRSQAEGVACPRGCKRATAVRVERTPIAETVEYVMPDGSIRVRCMRAAVLVGPYSCAPE